ncbi:hypothetical protein TSMEX_010332 [Taenia solium]|eukprot:TsM_001155400 transcript=TsM_001155400 gene=TsM_001155400
MAMVDYLRKVAKSETMKAQNAETVALIFFSRQICQHGVPASVHNCQDPNSESSIFTGLRMTFEFISARITLGRKELHFARSTEGFTTGRLGFELGTCVQGRIP